MPISSASTKRTFFTYKNILINKSKTDSLPFLYVLINCMCLLVYYNTFYQRLNIFRIYSINGQAFFVIVRKYSYLFCKHSYSLIKFVSIAYIVIVLIVVHKCYRKM